MSVFAYKQRTSGKTVLAIARHCAIGTACEPQPGESSGLREHHHELQIEILQVLNVWGERPGPDFQAIRFDDTRPPIRTFSYRPPTFRVKQSRHGQQQLPKNRTDPEGDEMAVNTTECVACPAGGTDLVRPLDQPRHRETLTTRAATSARINSRLGRRGTHPCRRPLTRLLGQTGGRFNSPTPSSKTSAGSHDGGRALHCVIVPVRPEHRIEGVYP